MVLRVVEWCDEECVILRYWVIVWCWFWWCWDVWDLFVLLGRSRCRMSMCVWVGLVLDYWRFSVCWSLGFEVCVLGNCFFCRGRERWWCWWVVVVWLVEWWVCWVVVVLEIWCVWRWSWEVYWWELWVRWIGLIVRLSVIVYVICWCDWWIWWSLWLLDWWGYWMFWIRLVVVDSWWVREVDWWGFRWVCGCCLWGWVVGGKGEWL